MCCMQGWRRFTTACFELTCIQNGNHLWPLDKAVKGEWLQAIVQHLDELSASPDSALELTASGITALELLSYDSI